MKKEVRIALAAVGCILLGIQFGYLVGAGIFLITVAQIG